MPSVRLNDPQLREAVIEQAIRAGKFPEARRPHYRSLWEHDPRGTNNLIAGLAPVPLPVAVAAAVPLSNAATASASDEALPIHLFPELGRTGPAEGRVKFCA